MQQAMFCLVQRVIRQLFRLQRTLPEENQKLHCKYGIVIANCTEPRA